MAKPIRGMIAVCAITAALVSGCTSDDEPPSASSGASGGASTSAVPSGSGASGSAGPTTSTSPPPAPATKPVPPPTAGNISETVPPVAVETKPSVPLDKPVDFGAGVVGKILKVAATNAAAKLPGEVAGPAIRVTVQITNNSKGKLDLSNVVVNLIDDTGAPGDLITSDQGKRLVGSLSPGKSLSGEYLFTVAKDRRTPVTIEVTYQAGKPVAQFVGNVS